MISTNNSLGSSPLATDQDDGGNPLFVATPRHAVQPAEALAALREALESMSLCSAVLDALGALEVLEAGQLGTDDDEVPDRCPGCRHGFHWFEVCSCGCDDRLKGAVR